MTAPRDMRGWMREVERKLARTDAIPRMISGQVGIVRDEIIARDSRTPTFPVELTYQTAFYSNTQGSQRARFLLDFPDVTKATDGNDITVDSYQLWARDETPTVLSTTTDAVPGLAVPGLAFPGLAGTPVNLILDAAPKPWQIVASSGQSYFRAENFLPGSVWRFRARAMSDTSVSPGLWSAEIVVQMVTDATPPPQPTAPTVTADRGVLTVTWDGQAVTGAMPADFKYAILAHGTDSSPTKEIARFGRVGGFTVVADIPYYDPQFFRLQAVDESGNVSPWSEQATGHTTPLVDTDIILSELDAAKTHLKNVDAGVSILPNTIITEHLYVTESMSAAVGQFLHLKAGQIDVNNLWADSAFFGLADAKLVRSDMFVGKSFQGGEFIGPVHKTHVEEYRGVRWDELGIRAWSDGGVQTFTVDAQTGTVATVGRFSTGAGNSPFVSIIPAEDSYNAKQLAVLMARDSMSMSGTDSAGMWVVDATAVTAQTMHLRGLNGGGVNIQNGLHLSGASTTMYANGEVGVAALNGDLLLSAGPGKTVNLLSEGGAYAMTSSSPANVYMHTTGQLFKSTSSLRYKTDVQDWNPGLAALGLQLRSWVDRNPVDPDAPLQRYYGFIAEEVDQVLPEMVTLNEFAEPDAVQYERIAATLVPVVRHLLERIEALEGQ